MIRFKLSVPLQDTPTPQNDRNAREIEGYLELKMPQDALKLLSDPSMPKGSHLLFCEFAAYKQLGDWEPALKAAERLREVAPGMVRSWTSQAEALQALGRHEEALRVLHSVKARFECTTDVLLQTASVLTAMKYPGRAIELLREAIGLDPEAERRIMEDPILCRHSSALRAELTVDPLIGQG